MLEIIYRENTQLSKAEYNITFHQGGLGDLIAGLPAVKYVLDNHPQIIINLWVQDYGVTMCHELFKNHSNIVVKGLSNKQDYNEKLPARSPFAHKISNLSSHLTDHAFYTIVGGQVSDKHKDYLELSEVDVSSFNLPKKYIVITTGFTSNTREFKPQTVKKVSDDCITKGYEVVYLGKSYTQADNHGGIVGAFKADYSNGRNLIDSTNLFEACTIMANAACVVGLDNGLCHLSCMSPKSKLVMGFTTVKPEHRLPYRSGIKGLNCVSVYPTEQELGCIGCQSKMAFATHSFVECGYGDYACLDVLSADKWINAIDAILKE